MTILATAYNATGDGFGVKTRHFQETPLVIFLTRDFLKNPSLPVNPSPGGEQ